MPTNLNTTYNAKDLDLYGAGFGMLKYGADNIDWVANFTDQGQPALGQPIDVMTINDVHPRAIIPPMAVSSGTLTFQTYALRTDGMWGSIFNGRFKGAVELVDLFRKQLDLGAITIHWVTTDVGGVPTKIYTYFGVVVTNFTKDIRVTNTGANQATHTFTCKYIDARESVKNA